MSCPHCAANGHSKSRPEGHATVLLVGNPNVGKSTLFNAVTGARQAVVNAPGTTVEVAQGNWRNLEAQVLDMPGTYSLIAQSPDEQVVVETLDGRSEALTSGHHVDLVLCVLDAGALARSLYLLGQIALTGRPVAAVLTMQDVAAADGKQIDAAELANLLGIPVMSLDPRNRRQLADLTRFVEGAIAAQPILDGVPTVEGAPAPAIRPEADLVDTVDGQGVPLVDADQAAQIFTWVDSVEKQLGAAPPPQQNRSQSDRIDALLLHPVIGTVVFLGVMWLLFMIAGQWVGPIQDLFDGLFTNTDPGAFSLANGIGAILSAVGMSGTWLDGLLIGGLCTGLGVVASFLPLMFAIFLMITILEDSGYMARAAFLGDRMMRKLGLDGRVILPLIMGFGCNLPSLAAARTLPNHRQRLVTILIAPYTSCAARLTIYLMIARIFFPEHTGTVVFALYFLSVVMVVLGALVLKPIFLKKQKPGPLMLVLPAYGTPRIVDTVRNTWLRSWAFVKGAGKIIVAMTMVVWLLGAIPTTSGYGFADEEMPMEDSLYGATAQVLEPVFAPAGFGEWHMTGSLMTGFVAKETVISSIVVSYNLDESAAGDAEEGGSDLGDLPSLITDSFTKSAGAAAPIGAFAFLVFVLTYTPCLATVAEQSRLIGGRRTAIAVGVQLLVAWLLAVGVFQIGRLFI